MTSPVPDHIDVLHLRMNPEETSAMMAALCLFDPEDSCVVWHGYSEWQAREVIHLVSLEVRSDASLSVFLTREQVAVLHCVVSSADVPWDGVNLSMESTLYAAKLSDGYVPEYLNRSAAPRLNERKEEELVSQQGLLAS